MYIDMFNGWYFFWVVLLFGLTAALYFLLKNKSARVQHTVLFSLLVIGLLMHFLKVYIPPYSVDEARMLRDSWFVNICGANIALFPLFYFSKSRKLHDYMFYIGVLSGIIAILYPEEPMAKANQLGETLDIIRFYYHHWMLMAVPLLHTLFGHHRISYRRVFTAPTVLLNVMLFIMLNQIFQSELGFIPLRDGTDFFDINYKNSSFIWGPGNNDAIGSFLALFTPSFFKTVPIGKFRGQKKYWPWFWMIVPVYVLVTPLSFLLSMFFDRRRFVCDMKKIRFKIKDLTQSHSQYQSK